MMVLGSAWAFIYGLSLLVVQFQLRVFLSMILYIPTRLISPFIFKLAVEYTGHEKWIGRKNLILVFFIPVLAILASLTSPLHHLFRYDFILETGATLSILHYKGGIIYSISTIYGNGLILAAILLLAISLRDHALQKSNTLLMITGLLVPVFVNILFSSGLTPIKGYSFAPTSLVLTGVAFAWALLRYRLFSVASVARATVVENIADLLLVFDTRGHIIDFNGAARSVIGLDRKTSIGAYADTLAEPWSSLFKKNEIQEEIQKEIRIENEGLSRVFEMSDNRMKDAQGHLIGRLCILHDITERLASEQRVIDLLAEKELLLREVHHRIKNNMSVISSILSLHADSLRDSEAAVSLLDARSRVQSMMVLYDQLYRTAGVDDISMDAYLNPLVTQIVNNFANAPSVRIQKNIDNFKVGARTLFPIGIIANELITNAMKHAFIGRSDGMISITATCEDDSAQLCIEDNGNGIAQNLDPEASKGFGLQLVDILVRQIGANLSYRKLEGSKFELKFKV
ncbi:hypothetical protein MASR2M78_06310 [Treponema sp.]